MLAIMDTPTDCQQTRWKTYSIAGFFLIPALCAWWFTASFLVPKSRLLLEESGITITNANALLKSIVNFGHLSFGNLVWPLLALISIFAILELRPILNARRRRLLAGAVVFGMNVMVFGSLICLAISHSIAWPVIHNKANFLAQYSHAAGVLPVAEQQWDSRKVAFKLGVDDLALSEQQQVNILLGILEGGATEGVCRGTVGSLLRYETLLRQRPAWSERFLNRVSRLSNQDLASMDEAVTWYQSVASKPEWQATL